MESRAGMRTTAPSSTPTSALPSATPGSPPPATASPPQWPHADLERQAPEPATEVERLPDLTESAAACNRQASLFPDDGPLRRALDTGICNLLPRGATIRSACAAAAAIDPFPQRQHTWEHVHLYLTPS